MLDKDSDVKTSNLFCPTLKETPNDAEIISHQLMLRAGLIRKLASGLYTWLPLGLKVLRKVESIIREEMNKISAQELLMPNIQPAELWEETHRWNQFGPSLLKIQDRHLRYFCYGPTHEEVVTDLMRGELKSYKQLPIIVYQIQTKFRDEVRPRFGVMRAREFLMKDAYSFHLDAQSLEETYQKMFEAYSNIFTRLGLKFRAVLADTGSIGGKVSHEFHVLADSGEDLLAVSNEGNYAANVELAVAGIDTTERMPATQSLSFVTTPGIKSVEEQAQHLKVETKEILKTFLVKGKTDEHPVVALLIRGDHELNPIKAEKHPLIANPCTLVSVEEMSQIAKCSPGFVGPKDLNIPLIADPAVIKMANFFCGANQDDTHYSGFNWGRDCEEPESFELRKVVEGDKSPIGSGTLSLTRGIEVGHIFQLGDKYSQDMKATVLDESGKARALIMGCYGIGVSRIVAAAIEQNHDERGIIWSKTLAPFQLVLLPMMMYKNAEVKEKAYSLYEAFSKAGIDVLLDDRNERAGIMFADSDLLGIPHRLVISEKGLIQGQLEYKGREDKEPQWVPIEGILKFICDKLNVE